MSAGNCELCGRPLVNKKRGQPSRFHKPCGRMVQKMREALGIKVEGYAGQEGRAHHFVAPIAGRPVGTSRKDPVPLTRATMENLFELVGKAVGQAVDDIEGQVGNDLPNMRSAARSAAFRAGNGKYLRPRRKG